MREKKYILAVDQSTQGTKGLLFDEAGKLVARADKAHEQIVNEKGWVEHNPTEIFENVICVCKAVMEKSAINKEAVVAFGISNQRETTVAWNKETGQPIANAIVWQCSRAADLCKEHEEAGQANEVHSITGMALSPYFPASKMQWFMRNVKEAKQLAKEHKLAFGTIDSWLIYNLTKKQSFKTDYSNASRTQLFDIKELVWSERLCESFEVPLDALPKVCMSDDCFGETDLEGILPKEIPICGVLGDSHGALFGQHCTKKGKIKATYGTGSSVMMNIGEEYKLSHAGIVTSLAWGMDGKVEYVFEGNLNYTGAVITWLKDNLKLIDNPKETSSMAKEANEEDKTYFVPAFTGLGAPYWDSNATGLFTGITRTTGRKELVKAGVECIAYQITDFIELMRQEANEPILELNVDGGPTSNEYLMQFQSDMANTTVMIPHLQELSGMGAAYMAGISIKLYDAEHIFSHMQYKKYVPTITKEKRQQKYIGWKNAIKRALTVSVQ